MTGIFIPDYKRSILRFSEWVIYVCKGTAKTSMEICYTPLQLQNRRQIMKDYRDTKLILVSECKLEIETSKVSSMWLLSSVIYRHINISNGISDGYI